MSFKSNWLTRDDMSLVAWFEVVGATEAGVMTTLAVVLIELVAVNVVTGVASGTPQLEDMAVELVLGAPEIIDDELEVSVAVEVDDDVRPVISTLPDTEARRPVSEGDVDSTRPMSKSAITLTSS